MPAARRLVAWLLRHGPRPRSNVARFSLRLLPDGNALSPNRDQSVPKANTGSAFLNWLADASTALVHVERRFDPFFRPVFDVVLRDPIAKLVTALINRERPNEGLKLAEE